jgi:hypothetical protein
MIEEVVKYLTVYFSSMVKFVGGPVFGYLSGLSFLATITFTILGMMTTVLIISLIGNKIKTAYFSKRKKKLFTKKNRRTVFIWKKFGLAGIAFLTPILFSPIIGTSVATAFGEKPKRIMLFMFGSAVFWSLALSFIFFQVGDLIL